MHCRIPKNRIPLLRLFPALSGRGWVALIVLLLATGRAGAHPFPPDITMAQLHIHYHLIDMTLRGPASELLGAAGVQAGDLIGEDTKKPILEKLTKWLPGMFALEKDHKLLTPEVVSADYQASSQANADGYTLEVHYQTDKPAEHLKLTSKFVHTIVAAGAAQFELHGDRTTTYEFNTQANLSNIWNNVIDFTQMGMEHLFTGPDHILFICTLIFALASFKSVVKMLTGFTIGHSITLILTTFNVFTVPARIADIGIALTIIYVGLENIFHKGMPKNRWWLVFVFGLIHGMGFSSALREVGLRFNMGIEIAQVIIVAAIYPVLSRLRWYKETLFGEKGTVQFRNLMNYGSAFTACMGFYWLFERVTGQ